MSKRNKFKFNAGDLVWFESTDSKLKSGFGQVVRPLTDSEADPEAGPMFLLDMESGLKLHAFQDELEIKVKHVKT
jgi:hypothetical protein